MNPLADAPPRRLRLVPSETNSADMDRADTPEARRALAEKYVAAVENSIPALEPIRGTLATYGVPPSTLDVLLTALRREIRWAAIREWQIAALVSRFTGAELEALLAFVSTAAGTSALRKLAVFSAEAAPAIAAEFQRAVSVALVQLGLAQDTAADQNDDSGKPVGDRTLSGPA